MHLSTFLPWAAARVDLPFVESAHWNKIKSEDTFSDVPQMPLLACLRPQERRETTAME